MCVCEGGGGGGGGVYRDSARGQVWSLRKLSAAKGLKHIEYECVLVFTLTQSPWQLGAHSYDLIGTKIQERQFSDSLHRHCI